MLLTTTNYIQSIFYITFSTSKYLARNKILILDGTTYTSLISRYFFQWLTGGKKISHIIIAYGESLQLFDLIFFSGFHFNGFRFARIGNQQIIETFRRSPQKQKCKIENLNHGKNAFRIAEGNAYNFHGTKYAEYLNKGQRLKCFSFTCVYYNL